MASNYKPSSLDFITQPNRDCVGQLKHRLPPFGHIQFIYGFRYWSEWCLYHCTASPNHTNRDVT